MSQTLIDALSTLKSLLEFTMSNREMHLLSDATVSDKRTYLCGYIKASKDIKELLEIGIAQSENDRLVTFKSSPDMGAPIKNTIITTSIHTGEIHD